MGLTGPGYVSLPQGPLPRGYRASDLGHWLLSQSILFQPVAHRAGVDAAGDDVAGVIHVIDPPVERNEGRDQYIYLP